MLRIAGTMLIRALGLVACLLFVVAVGVGRMVPAEWPMRVLRGVPPILLERDDRAAFEAARFADPVTGRTESLSLPARDVLENASCSPWVDGEGRRQVVGRWSQFQGKAGDLVVSRVGLARYRYPDGAVLSRVETDIVPFRSPCWYPGTSARILFVAGDGQLYQFAFENAVIGKDKPQARPEPVAVRPGVFGSSRAYMGSLCWPRDPRLGGRLIVSVTNLDECDTEQMARSSLWWITLNGAGNEVVSAGRVTESAPELAEISPSVGVAPDGTLYLAYLGQRQRMATWQLLLAPLHVDPKTGQPSVQRSETVELMTELCPDSPAFSADARYVTVQRPYWVDQPGLARVALPFAVTSESANGNEATAVSLASRPEADREG